MDKEIGMLRRYFERKDRLGAEEEMPHKKVEPLKWGLDSLGEDAPESFDALESYSRRWQEKSDQFFSLSQSIDFQLQGGLLTFSSPIQTETETNNLTSMRFFKGRDPKRAVLLIPWWNAADEEVDRFSRVIQFGGISTLAVTMPYHGKRQPPEMKFADYMLSSDLGRSIRSIRQAVLEVRAAVDWLSEHGYERIGLVCVSFGAYIGSLAAFHDPRIKAASFGIGGSSLADIVWEGIATRHIRKGIQDEISLEDLRRVWSVIYPLNYAEKRGDRSLKLSVNSAKYDLVVPERFAIEYVDFCKGVGIPVRLKRFSCGHYTFGNFPTNFRMVWSVLRFLRKNL